MPHSAPTTAWRTPRRVAPAAVAALALADSALAAGVAPQPAVAAVPDVVVLAGSLAHQPLNWERCDFRDSAYNERFAGQSKIRCATVTVPRDWHQPANGKTWEIRISQAKNLDVNSTGYKGTIFTNPGGPGASGLIWGAAMDFLTPELNTSYNYVGFDPRGVGQSSGVRCTYPVDVDLQVGAVEPAEVAKGLGTCSNNEDVRTINSEQTAYDMDFIRALLGAPKLSYVGYSYGTWLGTWYGNIFGAKYGDKFLLDSAMDATQASMERTSNLQPLARDRQFSEHFLHWVARNSAALDPENKLKLGQDPAAIERRYFKAIEGRSTDEVFLIWATMGGAEAFQNNAKYPTAATVVLRLIADGERAAADRALSPQASPAPNPAEAARAVLTAQGVSTPAAAREDYAQALNTLAALRRVKTTEQVNAEAAERAKSEGDPGQIVTIELTTDNAFDFVRCNDGQWTQGAAYWEAQNARTAAQAPFTASWGMLTELPACTYWRTGSSMPKATGTFPQTVVLQAELDSQTAWEAGAELGTGLPNTSFIAIDNEGGHGHCPYDTDAVDKPILDFFLTGQRPKANVTVATAVPLPGESAVYESWRRLNPQAKHVGQQVTNIWEAAKTANRSAGTKGAAGKARAEVKQELRRAEAAASARRAAADLYGEAGANAVDWATR